MKKQLTAVLLIFVLLLTMAGCSVTGAAQTLDVAEEIVEAKLDAAEEQLEYSLRKAAVSDRPAVAENPVPEPTEEAFAPEVIPGKLTQEQAQQIALDHLGLTADQVTRLRTHRETDDGMLQFEVEFFQGDWEYEFEIHAEDGKIISCDRDHKYD